MIVIGADIHSLCEVFNSKTGLWEKVGDIFDDRWGGKYSNNAMSESPIQSRNYLMFGILAGVRSYGELDPIIEPRGLPEDVSADIESATEEWGCDGHSHSWLTVKEITDSAIWDVTSEEKRYMSLDNYIKYAEAGKTNIDKYLADEYTYKTSLHTEDDMDAFIKDKAELLTIKLDNKDVHCCFTHPTPYRHHCGEIFKAIDRVKHIPPDEVRFVFWFDN